ncbi:MAG TPA: hypothetical protein VGN18_10195 [Jatrophihabitans sp.]|jgi:uncharacterized membrane protein|uniref:hypothetical protein n=1 Tax=Jatrophihabitans sp. TaxID=1932789 RepID=UPI002E05E272|nr:hypothetical protein [Jatrophihabitans sp.]
MALLGKFGFVVAAVGAAHFVVPEAFEEITAAAFPQDTQDWIQRNGITEVAVGTALMVPPTRKLGVLGLLGYAGWLGYNAANNSK